MKASSGSAVSRKLMSPQRRQGWFLRHCMNRRKPCNTESGSASCVATECARWAAGIGSHGRSEEHPSELQSLMRISYAVFCLKKKTKQNHEQSTSIEIHNQAKH